MITLVSLGLFIAMFLILALIDMFILQQSFAESVAKLLTQEEGTKEWMINAGVLIGLIYSLVIDYRLRKQAKNQ